MWRSVALLSLAVVIVISASFFLPSAPDAIAPGDRLDIQAEYWEYQIKKHGPEHAREMFNTWAGSLPDSTTDSRHVLEHAYGDAMYNALGSAGITYCSYDNSFGCWHQYMVRVMAADKTTAPDELFNECVAVSDGYDYSCTHSLGHGFMGIEEEYTKEARDRAIEKCDRSKYTNDDNIFFGCINGVIHEYYGAFVKLKSGSAFNTVTPEKDGVLSLCDGLARDARMICVRRLPDWWSGDPHKRVVLSDIEKLANTCARARDDLGSDIGLCYFGLGKKMYFSGIGDVACEQMSDNLVEVEWCKHGAGTSAFFPEDLHAYKELQCDANPEQCIAFIRSVARVNYGVSAD